MALGNATAIVTAIRERLVNASGTTRLAPADRFRGGQFPGMDPEISALKALAKASIGIEIRRSSRHADSPPPNYGTVLRNRHIVVTIVRQASLRRKASDEFRDALYGIAVDDSDAVAEALTAPRELLATSAGTPTGLNTGMLLVEAEATHDVLFGPEDAARIVTRCFFRGTVTIDMDA